jgi:hypothetical protein
MPDTILPKPRDFDRNGKRKKQGDFTIEYFDCASDADMQDAEEILKSKEIQHKQTINFPYLQIIWKE